MTRGRPRKCDPDEVLGKALILFWERGFEGVSMNDISAETGMAKPGLYATFGNKEQLFEAALTRYFDEFIANPGHLLAEPGQPIGTALRRFLSAVASGLADTNSPAGCFIANTLLESAGREGPVALVARALSSRRRTMLTERLRQAQEAGELDPAADAGDIAEFIAGQLMAMAALSSDGADRPALERFIETGLACLPLTAPAAPRPAPLRP